jgi:hypothetical protein
MRLDRGRIERLRDGILAKLGQRFKDRVLSSALGPAIDAIADGRAGPYSRGRTATALTPPDMTLAEIAWWNQDRRSRKR